MTRQRSQILGMLILAIVLLAAAAVRYYFKLG